MHPTEINRLFSAWGPGLSDGLVDTSDWISLKGAKGCWIYISEIGNGATNQTFTVHEGTTGTGTTAIAKAWPIYTQLTSLADDSWVKATSAITYTLVVSAVTKMVAFYIDASILTDGCDWIQLGASGGNAANYVSVHYQLVGERYQSVDPPTAIA